MICVEAKEILWDGLDEFNETVLKLTEEIIGKVPRVTHDWFDSNDIEVSDSIAEKAR